MDDRRIGGSADRRIVHPALELTGVSKRFGSVSALDGADFVLQSGTVHALLGENGAGKTTLMQVAFGLTAADRGAIRVRGQPVRIGSPREARRLGIGMVHQHFTSVGALTVGENLALNGRTDGLTDRRTVDRMMVGLDPGARVESLSVGLKQRLEVVKALSANAGILLLDEPTAVLVPSEVDDLLKTVREFAAAGGAVVLITHKLDEVFAGADEVTVLRQGRVTLSGPLAVESRESLARAMIGESMVSLESRVVSHESRVGSGVSDPPVVRLHAVTVPPKDARSPGLRGATLLVRPGEIVGVAAVEGNGQRELMLSVAGVLAPSSGTLEVSQPVALVPADRTTEGLIPAMSLAENVVLGRVDAPAWTSGPWIDWDAAERATAELLERFDVRATGPRATAALLSGGNQQKLVLARGLSRQPRVLVVENPTRGLDLRATVLMHERLRDAAAEGVAVLVYSSDLDEVLQLSTRLIVVCRGELVEFTPPFERGRVGQAMLGVTSA